MLFVLLPLLLLHFRAFSPPSVSFALLLGAFGKDAAAEEGSWSPTGQIEAEMFSYAVLLTVTNMLFF